MGAIALADAHLDWNLVIAGVTALMWRQWEKFRLARWDTGPVSTTTLWVSALFGTVSDVWLDSMYHAEMASLTPEALKLVARGDVQTMVESFCMGCALLALLLYTLRGLWQLIVAWKDKRSETSGPERQNA
jgi:hypothetical protein